ncbi:MAG: hypothetical protein J7K26_03190, partial [Candidatus Aenigmarchaeota archaeon]|nr:hypothetical protein [Candidatus Aenigmarchaeota archaeon]
MVVPRKQNKSMVYDFTKKQNHEIQLEPEQIAKAIMYKIDKISEEEAIECANLILDHFGFSEYCLDNLLEREDRDVFNYISDKIGIICPLAKERIILYNGKEWDIYNWFFDKVRALNFYQNFEKKKSKRQKSDVIQEARQIYADLFGIEEKEESYNDITLTEEIDPTYIVILLSLLGNTRYNFNEANKYAKELLKSIKVQEPLDKNKHCGYIDLQNDIDEELLQLFEKVNIPFKDGTKTLYAVPKINVPDYALDAIEKALNEKKNMRGRRTCANILLEYLKIVSNNGYLPYNYRKIISSNIEGCKVHMVSWHLSDLGLKDMNTKLTKNNAQIKREIIIEEYNKKRSRNQDGTPNLNKLVENANKELAKYGLGPYTKDDIRNYINKYSREGNLTRDNRKTIRNKKVKYACKVIMDIYNNTGLIPSKNAITDITHYSQHIVDKAFEHLEEIGKINYKSPQERCVDLIEYIHKDISQLDLTCEKYKSIRELWKKQYSFISYDYFRVITKDIPEVQALKR